MGIYMEQTNFKNGILYFSLRNKKLANTLKNYLDEIVRFIEETWKINSPENLNVYIVDSMLKFVFHSSSLLKKLLLIIFFPLWYYKAKKLWPFSAAWTLRAKKNPIIDIKSPDELKNSDPSIGKDIYTNDAYGNNYKSKWIGLACHELVHAFTSSQFLSLWLNEGIAQLTVEKFLNKETISTDTIVSLKNNAGKAKNINYRNIHRMEKSLITYSLVRGYWITRYLDEKYPKLLKEIVSNKIMGKKIKKLLVQKTEIDPDGNCMETDLLISNYFNKKMNEESLS